MNILLLCDRESAQFDGLDQKFQTALQAAGHEVQAVTVSSDELKPCVGCYGCWLKTPGLCVITGDRANEIAGYEVRADVLLLLSRLTYGGYSADVKAFLDRSIPNILPFFEIREGEMHHKPRYRRFPIWVAVGYGEATPQERQTFTTLAERHALNMRPPRHFAFTPQNTAEAEEAIQAIIKALEVQP